MMVRGCILPDWDMVMLCIWESLIRIVAVCKLWIVMNIKNIIMEKVWISVMQLLVRSFGIFLEVVILGVVW